MRIAFVSTSLARVGPVIVIQDLINSYPSHYEIDVFYLDNKVELKFQQNVKLHKISFFDRVDLSAYDVVHSHMMRADFFCAIRKNSIKRLVSTMHSNFKVDLQLSHGILIGWVFSFLWVRALKRFDCLVFLTRKQLNNFPELLSKSVVIHNGRFVTSSSGKKNIDAPLASDTHLTIGACAHVVKRKGFHQLVKMLALNDAAGMRFVLVGDGPELNNLINLSISLGVRDRFITPGYTEDVVSFIKSFDIYAMTSYSEGMPLALLESAACQCPIVCSNIDVVKEVFNEDEVTFYELDNEKSLLDAINSTINRKETQCANAHAKYMKCYTPEVMASKYLKIYQNQF